MGTIVEIWHDNNGIIWPKEVAPFDLHLIQIENTPKVKRAAGRLYKDLQKNNIEVLYDERDRSPGEKFAEADLIGIPYRIVISERTLKKNCVEIKKRNEEKIKIVKINRSLQFFKIKNPKSKIQCSIKS